MPELPEVETIRRGLLTNIVGKTITNVDVRKERLVRMPVKQFQQTLQNSSVSDIERRGKLLMFSFAEHDQTLLVHLKMTGQLIYVNKEILVAGGHPWPSLTDGLPNKYSHIIFSFEDGSQLFFNDQRQFGYMQLVPPEEKDRIVAAYGVDPIVDEFSFEQFQEALQGRTAPIKAVLLDQTRIAGIGNIYADEACFLAGIHPARAAHTLSIEELKRLHAAISEILRKAIKFGGTTFRDFRDAKGGKGNFTELLVVYGRSKKACVKCAGIIHKSKVAGRGTHVCLVCQPMK